MGFAHILVFTAQLTVLLVRSGGPKRNLSSKGRTCERGGDKTEPPLLLALGFPFCIERCHVEQKEQGSGERRPRFNSQCSHLAAE